MQTETVSNNLPPHLNFGSVVTKIPIETPVEQGLVAVVFVGNVLTNAQMRIPAYRIGGKLYPNKKTLPGGILARCAITPLVEGMTSVNKGLVSEADRKEGNKYVASYVAPNVWNPYTSEFESVRVGKGSLDGKTDHLLFRKLYPAHEVNMIVSSSEGAFGAVVVDGIKSLSDISEAQNFFFPNWRQIAAEAETLPTTLNRLRAHITERMAQTQSRDLQAVGASFMRAFADYYQWGVEYIGKQTDKIKDAEKVPGVYQKYSEVAERLFIELGLTRQDNLIQNISEQMAESKEERSELGKAVGLLTQLVASQQVNQQTATQNAPVQSKPAPKPPKIETPNDAPKKSFKVGAKVKVMPEGVEAEISDNQFGRYKVRFTDGSELAVPVENLEAFEVEQV